MSGFLLGFLFATGVAFLWLGAVAQVRLPTPGGRRIESLLNEAGLALSPPRFLTLACCAALLAGATAWTSFRLPLFTILAGTGGAYAPFAWLAGRRERRRREREQAWPAALAQIADALEAGIGFQAAVALVARSGPAPLHADFLAFQTRLRSGGLEAAIAGLRRSCERTAETVAALLEGALVELPAGGLAPILRELAAFLQEEHEAREKARSRAASLRAEARLLAASPLVILLLVGASTPGYLAAYRSTAGTLVGALAALAIGACYLAMRRLGRVPEPRQTQGGS